MQGSLVTGGKIADIERCEAAKELRQNAFYDKGRLCLSCFNIRVGKQVKEGERLVDLVLWAGNKRSRFHV